MPISLIFMFLAVRGLHPGQVADALRSADPLPVVGAVALIGAIYSVQAARWRWITRRSARMRWRSFLRLVIASVAVNNVIPGRPAPKLISKAVVERMRPGSVIVDIAAEQGGNCELTRAGEIVEHQGVKIIGAVNLPAHLGYNASEMYSRNLFNFLKPAINKSGELEIDWNDEVFAQSCLTHGGEIKHEQTRKSLEG